MNKIGLGVDYSNICKDFNTAYLDRDNDDRATVKCMNQVMAWTKQFMGELLQHFGYNIYKFNDAAAVGIEEIASKRFLFYSLEKEITLQKYLIQKEYVKYESPSSWSNDSKEGILVENDENGGSIYLYFIKGSAEEMWIKNQLKDFSVDEISFEGK